MSGHTRLDCKVPPGKARRGNVWTCPVCGLEWVENGKDRTSFVGAVLGNERENDGSPARLLRKPPKGGRR
jgi:hypothetical protein